MESKMTDITERHTNQYAQKKAEELAEHLKNAYTREFVFLLVGRTGVGKSSTINNLMGHQVAPVGDFEPETMSVEEYRLPIENVKFLVVDTPGLCDDLADKGNDLVYLQQIKQKVKHVDCLLYVTILGDRRVRSDEKHGIQVITKAFSERIWKNSVIVFTFADEVKPDKYEYTLKIRHRLIRQAIQKHASESIAQNIPAVAVDNMSKRTPDGKEWFGELYTTVVKRLSEDGFIQYIMATAPSLAVGPTTSTSSPTVERVIEKPIYTEEPVYIIDEPVYTVDRSRSSTVTNASNSSRYLSEHQADEVKAEFHVRGFSERVVDAVFDKVISTAVDYAASAISYVASSVVSGVKRLWDWLT